MKLAIVGAKQLNDTQYLHAQVLLSGVITVFTPELIISGGAPGVDTLAEILADLAKIPFKKFEPRNKRWEPNGFKERNIKIAVECGQLVRVVPRVYDSYGSGWTADYAEDKLNKKVYRFYV